MKGSIDDYRAIKESSSLLTMTRVMRHWLINITCGDSTVDQTPHELLKAAATVNRLVHAELKETEGPSALRARAKMGVEGL